MSQDPRFAELYRQTHDERVRQPFVGGLKGHLNGPLERALAAEFETKITPKFRADAGRDPAGRGDVLELFRALPEAGSTGSASR